MDRMVNIDTWRADRQGTMLAKRLHDKETIRQTSRVNRKPDSYADRQARDKYVNKNADKYTDRQVDNHTLTKADRQSNRKSCRDADRQVENHAITNAGRQTRKQVNRQADK